MTPDQIDALEELLFLLFALTSIPISWFYAKKRGRRPWLWALLAFFIAWIGVLLLRVLPDISEQSPLSAAESADTQAANSLPPRQQPS
jgi:hypothetical protein